MIFQNEKQILKIIKFAPSIFILTTSLIILIILYMDNKNTFKAEKAKIESAYIQKNKTLIKEQVQSVYNFIKREQSLTEYKLKHSLKEALDNAHTIAQTLYENNKHKSEAEVKKIIKDALKNIKFNDQRGYFFIYEKSGKNVLLPHSPKLEGKNFINHQDAKGTYIIRDFINLLKTRDEVFYKWYWFRPNDKTQQREKLGIVKNFKPFNWFIGTGEYKEDFEKSIQEKVLRHIHEIRFGKNGYIFIINYDSIYLSHIRKSFIGKNAITNNDTIDIKKVIQDLTKISKKGSGYYSYIQNKKPDNNLPIKKISYVKGLNEWNWMIGSGFYHDDMEKTVINKKIELDNQFRTYIENTIKITLLLTILLLLLSIYFSRRLQQKFENYKDEIKQHLLNNTRQQNIMAQQSKMAAMGEMIGNIAHQWRQPLSTITTTATGIKIQKELDILNDQFLLDGLDGINESAQYLSTTIDDFRNFFQIHKKKTTFNITKSFEKAISLVYVQFHNRDIEIIKSIGDITVTTYENELIQVIINLLNNCRDEFILNKTKTKNLIFIKAHADDNSVTIEIKDTAGGIQPSIIDRIFEPYFTTKHQSQGTGIGLYMSREIIIKHMEGLIEAKNCEFDYQDEHYQGAIFTITLPIKISS